MPMQTRSRRRITTTTTTIPEAVLVEILARLHLRSIARFKSVCKPWKSVIESSYFRRLFFSLHKNSSSSWSLMFKTESRRPIAEAIGFHGCETCDLPKSPGSYVMPFQPYPNLPTSRCFYRCSSNGLVLMEVSIDRTEFRGHEYKSFVGNPVLQEWVEIPLPPNRCYATGLLTRVDEYGLVSSFKVVMTEDKDREKDYVWNVYVYSSETGTWSFKRLLCARPVHYLILTYYPPEHLDGMYYLWERDSSPTDPGFLLAHDFYDPEELDDKCRVIPLPVKGRERVKRCLTTSKRCLTTSKGDVIYIQVLYGRLKVWRLNDNNSESNESWQLSWEIKMERVRFDVGFYLDYFPMAMNPFDTDIVYLWSPEHCCLVSGNLKTQKFIVQRKSEGRSRNEGCYRFNTRDSKGYMEGMYEPSRVLMLSQFVLPKWMDSVPRPPS